MRSLGRILRWQLNSRLFPCDSALPFVDGTRLLVGRGMTGASGNWYCGLHELEEMAFTLHALRPGDFFLDVGANVGSYTVLAAGASGADVLAVEPVPDTFRRLRNNVLLNDLEERVECLNVALGAEEGELRVSRGLDAMNHVLAPGEDMEAAVVPALTLDLLCADRVPTMVKIDVEGYEAAVVQGGRVTLADSAVRAVVMETNGSGERYGCDEQRLMDEMRGLGFVACVYDPFNRKLDAGESDAGNTIFVRDLAQTAATVGAAPRFQLVNGSI